MINYIDGDLIGLVKKKHFDMIVHGANCQNTMGSGIAKQIKINFPKAYEVDNKTDKGNINKLGSFTSSRILHRYSLEPYIFYVINAYTQYDYGKRIDHFNYDAFLTFLYSFMNYVNLMYESNIRKK